MENRLDMTRTGKAPASTFRHLSPRMAMEWRALMGLPRVVSLLPLLAASRGVLAQGEQDACIGSNTFTALRFDDASLVRSNLGRRGEGKCTTLECFPQGRRVY